MDTRQSLGLHRVSFVLHSAKSLLLASLSVSLLYFAECDLAHGKALPSDREKALGKAGFAVTTVAVWSLPSMPHSANPLPSALCALPCVSDTRQRGKEIESGSEPCHTWRLCYYRNVVVDANLVNTPVR